MSLECERLLAGLGIPDLQRVVLAAAEVELQIDAEIGNGRLLAFLKEHGTLTDSRYDEERMHLTCRLPRHFANQINGDEAKVTVRPLVR